MVQLLVTGPILFGMFGISLRIIRKGYLRVGIEEATEC